MKSSADIKQRLQQHLIEAKKTNQSLYKFFVIALNGSYNYDLATDSSDIDSKLLVIPSFEQLVWNKYHNYLHVMEDNGEHVEVKDVRRYMATIFKQNINFVETLFAKVYICNLEYEKQWKSLLDYREQIARYNPVAAVDCMMGMARQKQIQMTKMSEGRAANIEKFGYDTKSFHHAMCLYFFAEDYMKGVPYEECLIRTQHPKLTEWLIKAKTGELGFDIDGANKCIDAMRANLEPQVEYFKSKMGNTTDTAIRKIVDNKVVEIIKEGMRL